MSQIGAISSSFGYGNMIGGMSGLSGMGVKQSLATLASEPLSQIDTSGTGSISETQFEQAFAQAASGTTGTSSPSSATNAVADSIFQKIDANGDGKISADEWNTFQQKVQAHEGHGHHHHHAQAADAADSSTSSQSPAQTLQNLVAQLYKSADTNGNGQLSPGEITNWLSGSLALL